jgi:hypothetical protein
MNANVRLALKKAITGQILKLFLMISSQKTSFGADSGNNGFLCLFAD